MTAIEDPHARRQTVVRTGLAIWLLVGVGIVVALVCAARGPGLYADDWHFVAYRRLEGWAHVVPGWFYRSRPVGGVVMALAFAPFADHPVLLYLLVALANLMVALLLFRTLRLWFPVAHALGVALLWLVLPTRTSLRMWPSTLNLTVAVALGLLAVLAARRRGAVFLALASGWSYSAVCPLGAVIVLARRDVSLARRITVSAGFCASFVWSLRYPVWPLNSPRTDLDLLWPAHFGDGLVPGFGTVSSAFVVVAVIAVAVRWRRGRSGPADSLVPAGLAVVVLGTIPFLRFPQYMVEGMGDRSRVASGIGVAMVLAGAAGLVRRQEVLIGAACLVFLLVVSSQAADYRRTYEDALTWAYRAPAQGVYTERAPRAHDGVWSIGDRWNGTSALRYLTGNPAAVAQPTQTSLDP